ncbi:MAG TPA: DUF5702 domain-containing protein [Bacillales bacterium]|nr:DUF5702 domain-containing protein [Bacillales bacterium]
MKQWPKKFLSRFVFDQHGGVSIYLIIVTILLFLFNAVLIDYVRILVAQAQTENAAQAAARSTLASFDAGAHRYELFGMSPRIDATETFRGAFKRNLSIQEDGYFQFVDTKMEEAATSVKTSRPLSDPVVLKHQILEAMKYRAPIEFTKLIYKRFIGLSDAMHQASAFTDTMNAIKDDVASREKALDDVARLLKEARNQLVGIQDEVTSRDDRSEFPEIRNLNDIVKFFRKYESALPSEDDRSCKSSLQVQCDSSGDKGTAMAYEDHSLRLLGNVLEITNSGREKLSQAIIQLNRAKGLNNQINQTIKEHKDIKDKYYAAASSKSNGAGSTPSELKKVRQSVDDLVLKSKFFSVNEKNIKEALEKVGSQRKGGVLKQVNQFRMEVRRIEGSTEERLRDLEDVTERKFSSAMDAIKKAVTQFQTTRDQKNKNKAEQFTEAQRQRAEKQLRLMKQNLAEAVRNAAEDQQIYNQLQKLVEKYGEANSGFEKLKMEDPEETADAAMSIVDQLFKALGSFLEKSRNKIYVDEYILTYFTCSKPTGRPEDYLFRNREVEYILYGIPKSHANYQAALFELFAVRFALNFVESFTKPLVRAASSLPPPFNIEAILIAALSYSFENTFADLKRLQRGYSVSFISIGKYDLIDTFYNDYLRFFLFMNSGDKDRLRRIMAVIEHNSRENLTQTSTYIMAKARSSVKLWFIPGIEKLLGKAGVLNGEVRNNSYYITEEIYYSY